MHLTLRAALGVALCFAATSAAWAADWSETAFPKDRFAAQFPAAPKDEGETVENGVTMRTYVGVAPGAMCLIVVADYPSTIDANVELIASRDSFTKGVEGTLGASKRTTFPRGSTNLEALEFEAVTATFNFRSLIVVEGARAYQIAGGVPKDGGADADLERCVRGLRLTAN